MIFLRPIDHELSEKCPLKLVAKYKHPRLNNRDKLLQDLFIMTLTTPYQQIFFPPWFVAHKRTVSLVDALKRKSHHHKKRLRVEIVTAVISRK